MTVLARAFHALLLSIALAAPGAAHAQTMDGAFFALQRALGQVEDRASSEPTFVAEDQLAFLRQRIGRLQDASASIPASDRAAYADSLMAQALLLSESARAETLSAGQAQFAEAASDLEIKDQARQSLGLGAPLVGHVSVGVYAVRQSQRVDGLVVGASPVAIASAEPMHRFPRLSSAAAPTFHDLPPGRYNFVLLRGTQRVGGERISVGRQGQTSVTIDLVVQANLR